MATGRGQPRTGRSGMDLILPPSLSPFIPSFPFSSNAELFLGPRKMVLGMGGAGLLPNSRGHWLLTD